MIEPKNLLKFIFSKMEKCFSANTLSNYVEECLYKKEELYDNNANSKCNFICNVDTVVTVKEKFDILQPNVGKDLSDLTDEIDKEDEDKYLNQDSFELNKTLESLSKEKFDELVDKNEKELNSEKETSLVSSTIFTETLNVGKDFIDLTDEIDKEDEDKYLNEDSFQLNETLESLSKEQFDELVDKNEKELNREETSSAVILTKTSFDVVVECPEITGVVKDSNSDILLKNMLEERRELYKVGFCSPSKGVKTKRSEFTRNYDEPKRPRTETKTEASSSIETTSKVYSGPFFYPNDHKNDTHPLWKRYKNNDVSAFQAVQNDWKNNVLTDPNVDLTFIASKGDNKENISSVNFENDEKVSITSIYDRQIKSLYDKRKFFSNNLRNLNPNLNRKRVVFRGRIHKIDEQITVFEEAKKQLDYLISNYRNNDFDSRFVNKTLLDKMFEEKIKIDNYEDFYGQSE